MVLYMRSMSDDCDWLRGKKVISGVLAGLSFFILTCFILPTVLGCRGSIGMRFCHSDMFEGCVGRPRKRKHTIMSDIIQR
jgi:hypothetical protein